MGLRERDQSMMAPESLGLNNFLRRKRLQEGANLAFRGLGAWLGHVRVKSDGGIRSSKWDN